MPALRRFACFVLVVGESFEGNLVAAHVQMSGTDIRQQFPESLLDGSLLQHTVRLAEARLPGDLAGSPSIRVRLAGASRRAKNVPFSPMDAVFLDEVRAQVERELAEPSFTIETLALELALSPRQLRRKLVELTGETPQALLRRVRVERAEMLLRCGTPSVKEVAHAVGYATAEGLRRAFVAVRGSPPSSVAQT